MGKFPLETKQQLLDLRVIAWLWDWSFIRTWKLMGGPLFFSPTSSFVCSDSSYWHRATVEVDPLLPLPRPPPTHLILTMFLAISMLFPCACSPPHALLHFFVFFQLQTLCYFSVMYPFVMGHSRHFPGDTFFFNFFFLLILGFWNGCGTIQEKKGNKKNRKMEDMRVESFIGVWSETGGNRRIEREWKLAGKASNFFLLFSLYLKIIIEIKALKFKQY